MPRKLLYSPVGLAKPATAFTLVELLVVTTIISVMAALLLPALEKARNQAWTISCASQIKQIDLCSMNYTDDNSDFFAPMWDSVTHTNPYWFEILNNNYQLGKFLFKCPAGKGFAYMPHNLNYGLNYMATNYQGFTTKLRRRAEARTPSGTIEYGGSNADIVWDCLIRRTIATEYPGTRHNQGFNAAFMDGHVTLLFQVDALLRPELWNL